MFIVANTHLIFVDLVMEHYFCFDNTESFFALSHFLGSYTVHLKNKIYTTLV